MNVFFLDSDPSQCAKYHNDTHLNKMLVESLQLLCSSHHMINPSSDIPYKLTHHNHPCSKWVRESKGNYEYVLDLATALEHERIFRGFKASERCGEVLTWLRTNHIGLPNKGLTVPPIVTNDEMHLMFQDRGYISYYSRMDNVVRAYRYYYRHYKVGFYKTIKSEHSNIAEIKQFHKYKWSKRGFPHWINLKARPNPLKFKCLCNGRYELSDSWEDICNYISNQREKVEMARKIESDLKVNFRKMVYVHVRTGINHYFIGKFLSLSEKCIIFAERGTKREISVPINHFYPNETNEVFALLSHKKI